MIFLAVLPDEVHLGYWGRLSRWNGLRDGKEAVSALADAARKRGFAKEKATFTELLAFAASMPLREFVVRHTQLPYRRSFASHKHDLAHGDESDLSMIRLSANRYVRAEAFFCAHCVAKDVEDLGVSYWRRSHQIPGAYICAEHGVALHYVQSKAPFHLAPSLALDGCHAMNARWVSKIQKNKAVSEFLALSMALAGKEQPISVRGARMVLVERARKQNLAIHATDASRARLSDRILLRYPKEWLVLVFPKVLTKESGQIMHQLDGALYCSTLPSSVTAYLLAVGTLFDTAHEAIEELGSSTPIVLTRKRKRTGETTAQIPLIDYVAGYVRAQGSHTLMSRSTDIPNKELRVQLAAHGLPNLAKRGGHANEALIAAAKNFYLLELGLEVSAEEAGVTAEELERVVRYAGPNFVSALKQMPGGVRGNIAERAARQQTAPHLLGYASRIQP